MPDSIPEFISQRRRWLNGSFFAATYAIAHTGQILRSGHSVARKTVLLAETCYTIINLIFSWFSIVRHYSAARTRWQLIYFTGKLLYILRKHVFVVCLDMTADARPN